MKKKKVLSSLCGLFFIAMIFVLTPITAEAKFTDLLKTDAFSGSMEVISKFDFVGTFTQFMISVLSLLGLVLLVIRYMITLTYLSNKNFFDTIEEVKNPGGDKKFFGFVAMSKDIINGNHGTGMDSFISFLLMLAPSLKRYSDYRDGGTTKYNLKNTDTMTDFVLKTALPTITAIFIFTIGWNGVLWQSYANVADGMGVAARAFADSHLENVVHRLLNTGTKYNYAFAESGTKFGKYKQNLAESMDSKIISKLIEPNEDIRLKIGGKINQFVQDNVPYLAYCALGGEDADKIYEDVKNTGTTVKYANSIWEYSVNGGTKTITDSETYNISDEDTRALSYDVEVNSSENVPGAVTFDMSSVFGLTSSDSVGIDEADINHNLYVHVFIKKKNNANRQTYFNIQEEATSNTTDDSSTGDDKSSGEPPASQTEKIKEEEAKGSKSEEKASEKETKKKETKKNESKNKETKKKETKKKKDNKNE